MHNHMYLLRKYVRSTSDMSSALLLPAFLLVFFLLSGALRIMADRVIS